MADISDYVNFSTLSYDDLLNGAVIDEVDHNAMRGSVATYFDTTLINIVTDLQKNYASADDSAKDRPEGKIWCDTSGDPAVLKYYKDGSLNLETLVGLTLTQTLSNKVLTAPTINGGTLSGTLAGAVTFSGLLTASGGIAEPVTTLTDANEVLTYQGDNRYSGTPTASRDKTLPTSSVVEGTLLRIVNKAAFNYVLKASGGATIVTFQNGMVELEALQDTPTTAAHWAVRENSTTTILLGGSTFGAYNSGNQAISSISPVLIQFNTEDFDTNSDFASHTFTPTIAGKYQLNAHATTSAYASGDIFTLHLYKNGVSYAKFGDRPGSATANAYMSIVVDANGTSDNFKLYADSLSDASYSIAGGSDRETYFSGHLIVAE